MKKIILSSCYTTIPQIEFFRKKLLPFCSLSSGRQSELEISHLWLRFPPLLIYTLIPSLCDIMMDIQFHFSHPMPLSHHNKLDSVQTKYIAQSRHYKNSPVNYSEDTVFVSQQESLLDFILSLLLSVSLFHSISLPIACFLLILSLCHKDDVLSCLFFLSFFFSLKRSCFSPFQMHDHSLYSETSW